MKNTTLPARTWLLLAYVVMFTLSTSAAAPRYNVLFLMADDLRPDLGCYGNPHVRTPNLDKFAATALRFDRAYVQYPLCNPSRASLLTGRYPTTTGVLDNTTWFGAGHPDWTSLPRMFKDNGYAALRSGKIFHGGIDDAEAWTEGGEKRNFDGATNTKKKGQIASQSDRIVTLEGEGESHNDYKTATKAIEFLGRYQDKPFFLACGFTKPHSPPTAPKKFFDLYDAKKIPLPVDFGSTPVAPGGFPAVSVPKRNGDLFIEREASPDEAREMIRAYWASVSFMDAQVGRVLAELDRLKLRDKTIVLFWGDHGYHLGEKGKWSKHNSLFEIGTRVPLMIATPDKLGRNQICVRPVEAVDIYPTLVELCGLPAVKGLEGHSLLPLLKNPTTKWDHPAFTVTRQGKNLGKAVRTERWRYAEWDGGTEGAMLFDRAHDPHELKNLAADPAHAKTVAEMKELLKQLPEPK